MESESNKMNKLNSILGMLVKCDETMLNYKCKGHRGRSTTNKIDAFCIEEIKTR